MNYTTVENPVWTRDGEAIDCIVDFERIGKIPFTARPTDLPHCVEIYNRCVAGEFGPIAEYVPEPDEGPQPIPEIAPNQPPTVEGAQTL